MRESYRLHKQQYLYDMLQSTDKKIVLSLGYIGKEIASHHLMEKKLLKLLLQLCEQVAK